MIRYLSSGLRGPDVKVVQDALNYRGVSSRLFNSLGRTSFGDAGNFIWSHRSLKSPPKPILDFRTRSLAWVCFQ